MIKKSEIQKRKKEIFNEEAQRWLSDVETYLERFYVGKPISVQIPDENIRPIVEKELERAGWKFEYCYGRRPGERNYLRIS